MKPKIDKDELSPKAKHLIGELTEELTTIGVMDDTEKIVQVRLTPTQKKTRGTWVVLPLIIGDPKKDGIPGGLMDLITLPLTLAGYKVLLYLLARMNLKNGNLVTFDRTTMQQKLDIKSRTTLRDSIEDLFHYKILLPVPDDKHKTMAYINPRIAYIGGLGRGMEAAREAPRLGESRSDSETLH